MRSGGARKGREEMLEKDQLAINKLNRKAYIMNIGKTAGKKNADDRDNINQMRLLLSQAQRCRNGLGADTRNDLRLEFSQNTIIEYTDHSKVPSGVIYNPKARCFASYNEKGIHVWNPETGKRIFEAVFELGATQDTSKPKSFNEANRQISCVCYSTAFHLYFACTKNFQLLVFNEYLNCVEELPLNLSLVQQCIFVDKTQQLITCGVKGCFIVQLNIHYTYPPEQAILLNPKGDSITVRLVKAEGGCVYRDYYKFQRVGKWVKGMTLDIRQGRFVCWNETSAYFFEFQADQKCVLENLTSPAVFEGLTQGVRARTVQIPKDEHSSGEEDDDAYLKNMQPRSDADNITDVLLFNPMHYFVVSTTLGQILVFKWDFKSQNYAQSLQQINVQNQMAAPENERNREVEKPQLMNTFKGHSRSVTSMKLIRSSEASFVSASLDGTIRIWCLDRFIQLHHFQTKGCTLGTRMTNIQMLDDRVFAIMSKGPNVVSVGQISHLAKSYFISTPLVRALAKGFVSMDSLAANKTDSLIATFDNNSILLLDPETGSIKSTIYPPPTPTNIQTTLYSMALKRVFVFLQSGIFCVYKVEGRDTATLEKLQMPEKLRDYEGKKLTQTITALMLCSLTPPETDNEIFGDTFKYNPQTQTDNCIVPGENDSEVNVSRSSSEFCEDSDEKPAEQSEQFLVMGLSKGSVIFVRVNHIDLIYARFSVHKQQIEHIHELKRQKCIMTLCQENELKIWGFQEGKLAIFRKWNLQRPCTSLRAIEDPVDTLRPQTHILLTYPSGEAYFFQWSKRPDETVDLENKRQSKLNLRIMLPPEQEKWYREGEQRPEQEPKIDTEERLQTLISQNMLLNGQIEHDDEVKSIDYHCTLKLIASGDSSGLIKIWNYRRILIREITFTEPISALCFLNTKGDLIVGHKGKLSRILSQDYLPHLSLYEVPDPDQYAAILEESSAPLTDNFFVQIKRQNEETEQLNERIRKQKGRQGDLEEGQSNGLMNHLNDLFKVIPKFGMPMDEFKALLNKDERVPKLTDKRMIVNAMQAKLDIAKAAQISKDIFQPDVFKQSLNESIREQDRLWRQGQAQPKQGAKSPREKIPTMTDRAGGGGGGTQNSVLASIASELLPWRQGIVPNKRPGTTNAIPFNVGPAKPNHPKMGAVRNTVQQAQGGSKTRHQLTQERICDNIKFFNNPNPRSNLNILMVGQPLEQSSVFSEQRPISRSRAHRSKATLQTSFAADKTHIDATAISEIPMVHNNTISASQYQFPVSRVGVMNVFSTDQLRIKNQNYASHSRHQRKNLASANINVRRAEAFSSVTDSMSQPDFSIGMGVHAEGQSSTGRATATGTDSVRPISQPGLSKFQSSRQGVKTMRPGTVGMKTGRMFQRSDKIDIMRGSLQNSTHMTASGIADEFILTPNEQNHIKVSLMGRNKLNTASAEQAGVYPNIRRPQLNPRGICSAVAKRSPSRGFPTRNPLKRNNLFRDMKSQRNAVIATSITKAYKGSQSPLHFDQSYQQQVMKQQQQREQQIILIDTQTRAVERGDHNEEPMQSTSGAAVGVKGTGLPKQVVEINENVRELVITPSMRQMQLQLDHDKMAEKRDSGLSNATKGPETRLARNPT